MTSEKGNRKEKNQNIQVFVRLRPLNQRERDIKSIGVVEVVNNKEIVIRQGQQSSLTKKFTFDRSFGPHVKQVEVYQDVVSPLIEEVLAGYNCTVFAYGQTGTGKTHTMVGEYTGVETSWQNDPLAGIIPRALSQLFDELRLSNTEYTVRVSYLELYNEELFDLLSTSEDNSKLRIYEDVTRKGANIVNGLEEITVYNKHEVYKIMAQGQDRKRVASTLMNAQSSRSHTVFTIVVHMKENSPEGEELVKIGKLNLVDLAGSENISKAGSDNPAKRERARECVNINQSLLTLGRVITALVERHPHIPYRESKLTRILQESLGGRTKTSIIATISPGHKDIEETLSTLEYAHRAKNIQNKPEVNQKMTKKAILKEYVEEIDRLKRDLQAARDKNGVFLANETYAEITLKQEEQKREIQELLLRKRALEDQKDKMENVFTEMNDKLEYQENELRDTRNKLEEAKQKLCHTADKLQLAQQEYGEQRHLVAALSAQQRALADTARALGDSARAAAGDAGALLRNVCTRRSLESQNLELTKTFREQSNQHRNNLKNNVNDYIQNINGTLNTIQTAIESHSARVVDNQNGNRTMIQRLVDRLVGAVNEIKTQVDAAYNSLQSQASNHRFALHESVSKHSAHMNQELTAFLTVINESVARAHRVQEEGRGHVHGFVDGWYTKAVSQVESLRQTHESWLKAWRESETEIMELSRRQTETRIATHNERRREMERWIEEMIQERLYQEKRLNKRLEDLANERRTAEGSLREWADREMDRIRQHVDQQIRELDDHLQKKTKEIEEEKQLLEERISKQIEKQELRMKQSETETLAEEESVREYEKRMETCRQCVGRYHVDINEGTKSVTIDMESFTHSMMELLDRINQQTMSGINEAQDKLKVDVTKSISTQEMNGQNFVTNMDGMIGSVLDDTKNVMVHVVGNVEANTKTSIDHLTSISESTSQLISEEQSHLISQGEQLRAAEVMTLTLKDTFGSELDRHGELEDKYLTQEYKVYAPTGSTPVRCQYRVPPLVAPSPLERVLLRYRQRRAEEGQQSVIECPSSPSDSECSVADEGPFAVPGAPSLPGAPSPPGPPSPRAPCNTQLVKSTSETDVYAIRKQQQGKENVILTSSSTKKASKLPAPTSNKKPLVERNGTS